MQQEIQPYHAGATLLLQQHTLLDVPPQTPNQQCKVCTITDVRDVFFLYVLHALLWL